MTVTMTLRRGLHLAHLGQLVRRRRIDQLQPVGIAIERHAIVRAMLLDRRDQRCQQSG